MEGGWVMMMMMVVVVGGWWWMGWGQLASSCLLHQGEVLLARERGKKNVDSAL